MGSCSDSELKNVETPTENRVQGALLVESTPFVSPQDLPTLFYRSNQRMELQEQQSSASIDTRGR